MRILMIGAHQDDNEFRCGGLAHRLVKIRMPVIMYNEDRFKNPSFRPDIVLDMDDEIETKLEIAHLNECQVYEWLPYAHEYDMPPEGDAERREWLAGMHITSDTTDEEVLAAGRGYRVRYARPAAKFREQLIEQYGEERGKKIRYAEAFEICEYGGPYKGAVKELIESAR